MSYRGWVCVMLVSSVAFGFQNPAQQVQSLSGKSSEQSGTQIAPDAPVITLQGPCSVVPSNHLNSPESGAATPEPAAPALAPVSATPTDSGCKIVITRAEFENLANALHPDGSPSTALSFARRYSETLVLAQRAHESGYDQDPVLQAKARFSYLQFVGQGFNMQLREKADR